MADTRAMPVSLDESLALPASSEVSHLPKTFLDFCALHKLDVRMYSEIPVETFPRFIRLSLLRRHELAASSHDATVECPADSICDVELQHLRTTFGPTVQPVKWIDPRICMCVVDGHTNISSSALYQSGLVHGMDVSSAASVLALDPKPGDNVLDMCCAPGAKLCLIAEMMQGRGSLVGVDFSADRLSVCATMLRKYQIVHTGKVQKDWRLQLFACDGRTFGKTPPMVPHFTGCDDVMAPSVVSTHIYSVVRANGYSEKDAEYNSGGEDSYTTSNTAEEYSTSDAVEADAVSPVPCCSTPTSCTAELPAKTAEVETKSSEDKLNITPVFDSFYENAFRRKHEQRRKGLYSYARHQLAVGEAFLSHDACDESPLLYDKIIVDAECTHDGSLKHIAKFGSSWGWDALHEHMTSDVKSVTLTALQRGLISNAFTLLREGGSLVYSTCSLTTTQNEEVVQWLLDTHDTARLIPVTGFGGPVMDPGLTLPNTAAMPKDLHTSSLDDLRAAFHDMHAQSLAPTREGFIPGTVRFEPLTSGCGGLFIAKLTKIGRS